MTGREDGDAVPLAIRTALVAQLRKQLPEIEEAVYFEVRSVSAHGGSQDPEYLAGLRAAVAEVIDYGITGIERDREAWSSRTPLAAAPQARRAARSGIELDTVLRRYAAGDRLLSKFILNQADRFPTSVLQQVLKEQGSRLDHLMAAVSREYTHELEQMRRSPTSQVSERIKRLLADNGSAGVDGLNYVFDAWHLGVIAKGEVAEAAVRGLASALDRETLSSREGDGIVWAWLGGRRPISMADVERVLIADDRDVSLALGEPHRGFDGWRLTHHEAQAALSVMLYRPQRFIRGSNVLLLAAVLRDEALAKSLLGNYLGPVIDHNSGTTLCRTLGTYISTGFNAASTSAILGVDRSTVQRHLRKIEERLGRPLHTCHAELKVALEFKELKRPL